jgi:tetratricopeptide (TPR) repeat protein
MQSRRLVAAGLVMLAYSAPGCQLSGRGGPVSESLAASRQLSQQGIAALERGQWVQAESLLGKAVDACSVDVEARRNYAEALWHRERPSEAIAQLQEAARLASEDATLEVRLAEMHLTSGRVETARRHAEKAVDLNPKLSAAWAIRGRTMQAGGDARRALADYHRALAAGSDDQAILLEIAELYRRLNQPQRALAALHRLGETYPPGEEPQQVLYLEGLAYLALARPGDAAEAFSLASTRGQPSPEFLCRLAEAQLAAGRPDEAAATAREALALDPQHAPSQELLGRADLARQPAQPVQR